MNVQPSSATDPLVLRQPLANSDEGNAPPPSYIATCLPSLEALTSSNSVCIEQIVDGCTVIADCRLKKYEVRSPNGLFYRVREESSRMSSICLGPARGFTMHLTDENLKTEVLTVHREYRPCMGLACSDCCIGIAQSVTVNSHGIKIGTIIEKPQCIGDQIEIRSANGELIGIIEGPACLSVDCCCSGVDFWITTPDFRNHIGDISWQYLGCWKHCFSDKGCIVVNFTGHVDVQMKALMIGAAFLMDFRFFEVRRRKARYLLVPIVALTLNLFCSAVTNCY